MKRLNKWLISLLILLTAIPLMADPVRLSFPRHSSYYDTTAMTGETFLFPVITDSNLTGENITSYQLQIYYYSTRLEFLGIDTVNTLTNQFDYIYVSPNGNNINIAAIGSHTLADSGVLVNLKFRALSSGGAEIYFTDAAHNYFNEGSPQMTFTTNYYERGYANIINPPYITVSSSQTVMAVGDSIDFSVYYGTSPYTWRVSDLALASIDASGMLKGLAPGKVWVIAEDAAGVIDSSNTMIEIMPFKLFMPDTAVYQENYVDIPVYTTDLTSQHITSGYLEIKYNEARGNIVSVLSTGTLVQSYGQPVLNDLNGFAKISFAGTTPLTGKGVLFYIRYLAKNSSYGYQTLYIENVLFNEDIRVKTENSDCYVNPLETITITPGTKTLLVSQTQAFSASGGTLPYTWTTSDPNIASIDESGVLLAKQNGTVQVIATDILGAQNSSGNIRIYDLQVTLPDTSAPVGLTIDYPVYVDKVYHVSESIQSFETQIEFDASRLTFDSIIQDSTTLTEDWSITPNVSGNLITLAGANTIANEGNGILFKLRFHISSDAYVGAAHWIRFKKMTLNEGNPEALGINGYIRIITNQINMAAYPGHTVYGDTVDLHVADGAPPYRWRCSDNALAVINNNGQLIPQQSGKVMITVKDGFGRETVTDSILIYDTRVSTADTLASRGCYFDMPVSIGKIPVMKALDSVSINILFDDAVAKAVEIRTQNCKMQGWRMHNAIDSGIVYIRGKNSAKSLNESGDLFYIRFLMTEDAGEIDPVTSVAIGDYSFNDGDLAPLTDSGIITLTDAMTITPPSANLLFGTTATLAVTNGVPPYTWSTANSSVLSIDDGGKITALSGGQTVVSVTDSWGSIRFSDDIFVYDALVKIADKSASMNETINLPVYLKTLNPEAPTVLSFEGNVWYDTTGLSFLELATDTSCLADGWSIIVNADSNRINIAASSVSAISDTGTLFYLCFYLKGRVNAEQTYPVEFHSFMFNEGSPNTLTESGSINVKPAIDIQSPLEDGLPTAFKLMQNYPNPFNPVTTISYELPKTSYISLFVYNINGQLVEQLVNGQQAPGRYSVQWNASRYSSGMYIYKIQADSYIEFRKCMLMK